MQSWVLTGVGSTNIKLRKVEGGFGLPNPSPLRLTFNIGWDSHIHKLIEDYNTGAPTDGVLYYINGGGWAPSPPPPLPRSASSPSVDVVMCVWCWFAAGKAVARLSFTDAVLAAVKFPRMNNKSANKKDKQALVTVILQPATSKVEKVVSVKKAPEAPAPDLDKMRKVTRRMFKVEIDGIDTSKVSRSRHSAPPVCYARADCKVWCGVVCGQVTRAKLPTIVANLKRVTRYHYSPEEKKQVRDVKYKIKGLKKKQLFLSVPKDQVKPWKDWQSDPHPRPRVGTVEIQQPGEAEGDLQPLMAAKMAGYDFLPLFRAVRRVC